MTTSEARGTLSELGSRLEISLAVTLHNEGVLAHSALRSAQTAYRRLTDMGVTAELLVTLDRATAETRTVVRQSLCEPTRIHELDFGDLGRVRNYLAGASAGVRIAYLDGDDVWGPEWPEAALAMSKQRPSAILHTEMLAYFGTSPFVRLQDIPPNSDETLAILISNWLYANNCIVPVDIVRSYPYPSVSRNSGLGHEDWAWSTLLAASAVERIAIPGTVYYCRQADPRRNLSMAAGVIRRPVLAEPPSLDSLDEFDGYLESALRPLLERSMDPYRHLTAPPWFRDATLWASQFDPDVRTLLADEIRVLQPRAIPLYVAAWRHIAKSPVDVLIVGLDRITAEDVTALHHRPGGSVVILSDDPWVGLASRVSSRVIAISPARVSSAAPDGGHWLGSFLDAVIGDFAPHIINAGCVWLHRYLTSRRVAITTLKLRTSAVIEARQTAPWSSPHVTRSEMLSCGAYSELFIAGDDPEFALSLAQAEVPESVPRVTTSRRFPSTLTDLVS